jgi:hypothetical protein
MRNAVRGVVEVAAGVDGLRRAARGRLLLQQEELHLGMGVVGEAEIGRVAERPLQHVPRVRVRRCAIGHPDVAEHPADPGGLAAPGQQLEGGRVRPGQHVRLVDPGETLDGRAIEADPLGERPLKLGGSDRHGLQIAKHVREPQPDKTDVPFLQGTEDEFFLPVHDSLSLLVSGVYLRSMRQHSISADRACPDDQCLAVVFPARYMTSRYLAAGLGRGPGGGPAQGQAAGQTRPVRLAHRRIQ